MGKPSVATILTNIREWHGAARANGYFRMGIMGAIFVAVLDQASKSWIVSGIELPTKPRGQIEISGIFDLTYVQNYGASFGMLSGGMLSRVFLSLISIGVVIALTYWLGTLKRLMAVIGVAFIIGGALGNLYDRVAYGYVVDFLDFSGLMFPWVFNVADVSINIGIAFLLLDAWQTRDKTAKSD